jgi:hypothetical protein
MTLRQIINDVLVTTMFGGILCAPIAVFVMQCKNRPKVMWMNEQKPPPGNLWSNKVLFKPTPSNTVEFGFRSDGVVVWKEVHE